MRYEAQNILSGHDLSDEEEKLLKMFRDVLSKNDLQKIDDALAGGIITRRQLVVFLQTKVTLLSQGNQEEWDAHVKDEVRYLISSITIEK